jgi:UDPglucose--hexose-1-phosphate uridylyltransferase
VLVSPHRNARPWRGAVAQAATAAQPSHDPTCHLCPGNRRANGQSNPVYDSVYVFDNDFPAVQDSTSIAVTEEDEIFAAEAVRGACRVICYSPDHGRTMSRLDDAGLRNVVDCWAEEISRLGVSHRWVQVFENKGEMMGCSNPHPHGQIWATDHLPEEAKLEDLHQQNYFRDHGRALLLDVAEREAGGDRQVIANDHWLVIVPWWATWPFETLVLPRFAVRRLPDLAAPARDALARTLGELSRRYDALFDCDFPYSMGWHGAPEGGGDSPHWQLHAHFYPPLLRSATVRKFMVGYEMLAEAQRDLTPEQAAERLRDIPTTLQPDTSR